MTRWPTLVAFALGLLALPAAAQQPSRESCAHLTDAAKVQCEELKPLRAQLEAMKARLEEHCDLACLIARENGRKLLALREMVAADERLSSLLFQKIVRIEFARDARSLEGLLDWYGALARARHDRCGYVGGARNARPTEVAELTCMLDSGDAFRDALRHRLIVHERF